MRTVRGLAFSLVVFLLLGAVAGWTQDPAVSGKVDLKVVKYDGLAQEVQKHKGKVVVVDAWGIYCIPCKKGLPHLIEMQNKYGGKGLVGITLHVDPQFDAETQTEAMKFLKKSNAKTINLILDEPSAVWQDKLHSLYIPIVFVFNREGKWTQFDGEKHGDPEKMYEAIDKLVVQSLAQQ